MILANQLWGGLLAEHNVPGIYRSQQFMRTRMSTTPGPHESIGVPQYIWSTSPLRRYVDLINQGQIMIDDGIIGTDHVNAADLQIGATLSVLLAVGDSAGLFADEKYRRIAETVGLRAGQIPAGAFPPGWVPAG